MSNDDEINVEYDNTTNITTPTQVDKFCNNLSQYLYPKLTNIDNNGDFTAQEIEDYSLDVSNDKINISTTRKLIKYLKSYARKSTKILKNEYDEKYEELNSYIHTDIADDIQTVVERNLVNVNSTIEGKANIIHTHNITDINSLEDNISSINNTIGLKANASDVSAHINDKNNPHEVTLEKLGLIPNAIKLHPAINLYTYGSVVTIHFDGWKSTDFTFVRNTYVQLINVNIPSEYLPPKTIYIRDVVTNQHVIIGSDGHTHVMIGNDVVDGTKFNGQATWITI